LKRAFILIVIGAVLGGGAVYLKTRSGGAPDADDKPAAEANESAGEAHLSHDTNGNAVITLSDETRKEIGLQLGRPAPAQFGPEVKGYGRVEDAANLGGLAADLATAEAVYVASSNELERSKTLESQGNSSARTLQTAEAAAVHDRLAVQSAHDRLLLASTASVADRPDLPAFVRSLADGSSALVRIDVSADEVPAAMPVGARILTLSGALADADFLGTAAAMDPQTQGRGYFVLVSSNSIGLAPGQAVTGYLKLPGEAVSGVTVPRDAVVRTEGAGWVYVQNGDGKSFTRKTIPLDHFTDAGWFVTNGVSAGDSIVVVGAQTLLSEELKAAIQPD
jgi:hypothetical protein